MKVIVCGYEKNQGVIRVALFNTADHFLEKPFRAKDVSADDDVAEAIFDHLPEGKYAIAAFLD